jgi:hypothetical protein
MRIVVIPFLRADAHMLRVRFCSILVHIRRKSRHYLGPEPPPSQKRHTGNAEERRGSNHRRHCHVHRAGGRGVCFMITGATSTVGRNRVMPSQLKQTKGPRLTAIINVHCKHCSTLFMLCFYLPQARSTVFTVSVVCSAFYHESRSFFRIRASASTLRCAMSVAIAIARTQY